MSIARPMGMYNKSTAFPPTRRAKLVNAGTWSPADAGETYANGGTLSVKVKLNSAYDPWITGGTANQQGLYYDQLRFIYQDAVVLAAKVTITYLTSDDTEALKIVTKLTDGNDLTWPEDQVSTANEDMTLSVMKMGAESKAVNTTVLSRYVNMSQFFGQKVIADSSYKEHENTGLSDNDKLCIFLIWHRRLDGANQGTVVKHLRYELTQYILFSGRVDVAKSV